MKKLNLDNLLYDKRTVQCNVRLAQSLHNELEAIAEELNTTTSEVIRQILASYVNENYVK